MRVHMLRYILLHAIREKNNATFRILAMALAIAVMAITAITTLTTSIEQVLTREGGSLLGGDLLLESAHEMPPALLAAAKKDGLEIGRMVEFFSMIGFKENYQIANIMAFYDPFPLRGKVRMSVAGKSAVTLAPPPQGEVWCDESFATLLNLKRGQAIALGNANLKVTATLLERPLALSNAGLLAPILYVNAADLPKMAVLQSGSRATYRLIVAGEKNALNAFKQKVLAQYPELKAITAQQGRTGINRTFEQAESYLKLILLTQILLASFAIALCAYHYATNQTRKAALWRVIGARSWVYLGVEVAGLFAFALLVMSVAVIMGYLLAGGGIYFAKQYGMSLTLSWQGGALGFGIGLMMLFGFALPPLFSLRNISPLALFQQRNDVAPSKSLFFSFFVLFLILFMVTWSHHNNLMLRLSLQIASLAAFTFGLIWFAWYGFSPLERFGALSWRFAIGYLKRYKSQVILQWLIFTLVLMLLLLVQMLQKDFLASWQKELPPTTPNYFLINIQPNQVEDFKKWFLKEGIQDVVFYPIVRGRMSHINGISLESPEEKILNRGLSRPINLTWTDLKHKGLSIEEGFAQRQQLKIGDTISFEIADTMVTAPISQVRRVDWASFKPNFYVIFPVGFLEKYPHTYMTSVFLPAGKRHAFYQFSKQYSEVSMIDIDAVVGRVRDIINNLSLLLQGLLLVVLVLSIIIFYAGLLSTLKERLQESALLQILGASKAFVVKMLAIEFIVLGLLAGILASLLALILAKDLAHYFFSFDFFLSSKWIGWGVILSTCLMTGLGMWGARSVLTVSPLHLLRKTS